MINDLNNYSYSKKTVLLLNEALNEISLLNQILSSNPKAINLAPHFLLFEAVNSCKLNYLNHDFNLYDYFIDLINDNQIYSAPDTHSVLNYQIGFQSADIFIESPSLDNLISIQRDLLKSDFSDAHKIGETKDYIENSILFKELLQSKEKSILSEFPPLIQPAISYAILLETAPFWTSNDLIARCLLNQELFLKSNSLANMINLSKYFNQTKDVYANFSHNSSDFDLNAWINYFLQGVIITTNSARNELEQLLNYFTKYDALFSDKRLKENIQNILIFILNFPIFSSTQLQMAINFDQYVTAIRYINRLIDKDIIKRISTDTVDKYYYLAEEIFNNFYPTRRIK